MPQTNLNKKRLDDLLFVLRIYEMYSKNAPYDIMLTRLCEEYRKKYEQLLDEYLKASEESVQ